VTTSSFRSCGVASSGWNAMIAVILAGLGPIDFLYIMLRPSTCTRIYRYVHQELAHVANSDSLPLSYTQYLVQACCTYVSLSWICSSAKWCITSHDRRIHTHARVY
jgi:hypothetical protein